MKIAATVVLGFVALSAPSPVRAQCHTDFIARLDASDGMSYDRFGFAVALRGDLAMFGAPGDEGAARASGTVCVFQRVAGTWTQVQTFFASDGQLGDQFGSSIAIDGSRAVIGAPSAFGRVQHSGAAYVFEDVAGTWTQVAKLVGSDIGNGTSFGASVGLVGDTILVSAGGNGIVSSATPDGAAYVFERSSVVWRQTAKLEALDTPGRNSFGYSVALSTDRALIGALGSNTHGFASGAAYVFDRANGAWTQTVKLTASDGEAEDVLGASVALEGERALVGTAPYDHPGKAYVFDHVGGVWSETTRLTPFDRDARDRFGFRVALHGDEALVAAYDPFFNLSGGFAYRFLRLEGEWEEAAKLRPPLGTASNGFGFGLALDADTTIVGAYYDEGRSTYTGAAYVFPPTSLPCISRSPMDQTVVGGDEVTLGVIAVGVGALAYQWSKDGVPISGATSSEFTIPSVVVADAGDYYAMVTDGVVSVTSDSATLRVFPGNDPRAGNVNVGAGPLTDVVFVNGGVGVGRERRLVVGRRDPFQLRIESPPSRPTGAHFAFYAWRGEPTAYTRESTLAGTGDIAMPTPIFGHAPQPLRIANNLSPILGVEHWPGPRTRPAPTVLLDLPSGLRLAGTFYLQGIIVDPNAPNGRAAVTNGIVVESQ